jgi:hypothetical protein
MFALFATQALTLPVLAADVNIYFDGQSVSAPQAPFIENGTTMIPFRAIFETLGCEVEWISETRTVLAEKSSANTQIRLQIDNKTAEVNGVEKTLTVAPKIVGSSTMVPLRFVSEALGYDVAWNGNQKRVDITSKTGTAVASSIEIPNL